MNDSHPVPQTTVPAEIHFGLQAEFVRLAAALGIEIKDGTTFVEGVEQCHQRANIAAAKAAQYDAVLSMLDGAADALEFAGKSVTNADAKTDIKRAQTLFIRALPILRELAGK